MFVVYQSQEEIDTLKVYSNILVKEHIVIQRCENAVRELVTHDE